MRFFRHLIMLFLFSALIFSCQKELNFSAENNSKGSLKKDSTSNDCLEIVINGTYEEGVALNNENYMYVLVNVETIGNYNILSDTLNGFWFSGTGTFGNTGPNLVKLKGEGTPVQGGISTFKITYDTSTCIVDVVVKGANFNDAVYSIGGNGGACSGALLSGTYNKDVSMTASNLAQLNISISNPGNYSIKTDTINGVSFSSTGSFTNQTNVQLIATGTPADAGTYNYTVTGGGNTCTFSVTFENSLGPADFTLGGSPGECTNSRQGGVYTKGIATNATNTDTINVKVNTPGTYTITTDNINGVSFSGTGVFTNTGVQDVVLYATGTPTENGKFTYTVTVAGNSCSFVVSTDYIICDIDGQPKTFNIGASWGIPLGQNLLSIDGNNNSTQNFPAISLQIQNGSPYTVGTYQYPTAANITLSCYYFDENSVAYFAGDPATGTDVKIIITSITDKRLEGTFSGTFKDGGGVGTVTKVVTNGSFSIPKN